MRETRRPLIAPMRSLGILSAVIADGSRSSVAAIARSLDIPVASAHRHVEALVTAGYLVPSGYGRHLAGPAMRTLASMIDDKQLVTSAAALILEKLASRLHCVVQLGTLENDMVTYRLKAGTKSTDLFTKVGLQLEAYCSAIGKVLLAHMSPEAQAGYFNNGSFVALTPNTITDRALLKAELDRVVAHGFAFDNEEVALGLQCLAVPIRAPNDDVIAAISASRSDVSTSQIQRENLVKQLKDTAFQIEAKAFGKEILA